jgi:hypothetical protein
MPTRNELGGILGLIMIIIAATMCFLTAYAFLMGQSAGWIFFVLALFLFFILFYFISIGTFIRYITKVCAQMVGIFLP